MARANKDRLNKKARREQKRRETLAAQVIEPGVPVVRAVEEAEHRLGRRPLPKGDDDPYVVAGRRDWDRRFAQLQQVKRMALPQDALEWQEQHDPTEIDQTRVPVVQKVPGKGESVVIEEAGARRRICDLRLWRNLDTFQQEAILQIDRTIKLIASGVGLRTQSYERRSPGRAGAGSAREATLHAIWMEWSRATKRARVSHDALMRFFVDGKSLTDIDGLKAWQHGTARNHLTTALDEWCYADGTKRRPRLIPERGHLAHHAAS